ncbi:MAG: TAXI family TRAP transporter solute-binding subunit [Parvibaculum sp.]|uniref:TAXI family TRAP transporter solute-binding subunit n=2 Tax=Parvibaculum sp. TaxID=2024848 RepID=UPI001DEA2537|nr:TAXI family TRAP transporter solute-binding subunit [Parvibaculum sp.]MBX3490075.1 TAXI family TRAP transporter solute-binding subunit [Parvibaculum sp.]MBX3495034.1 TAXI family TRAP transporter solute-binding subunit [Parvibaculum sp.]
MNFGKQTERMREIAALLAAALARVPARPLLIALAFSLIATFAAVLYWNPPLSLEDEPDKVTFFQIGTGVVGGEYFAVGERLAAAISRPPGSLRCERGLPCGVTGLVAVARSSAGPVANVRAVSAGLFDSAIVAAPVLDLATRAEGPFRGEKPFKDLRAIAGVYREAVYLAASRGANITDVAGLKEMRVSIGLPGSGTQEAALQVLAAHGLTRRMMNVWEHDTATAIDLMLRGQLDAFFVVDALPSPVIRSIADRGSIDIVPIDGEETAKLTGTNANFQRLAIPDGLYRFVPETVTLGVSMIWIVNEDADAGLIYDITDALFRPSNRVLLSGARMPGLLPGEEDEKEVLAIRSLPVPLHDGAARYYREEGYLVETGDEAPAR